jgi:hypothetical protein
MESLCRMRLRPAMDHQLWGYLRVISRDETSRWDYFVWSSWADGLLAPEHYSGPLDAVRILMDHAERVWQFGGPEVDRAILLRDPADRVVTVPWARSPGPWIRVFRLRSGRHP